MKLFITAIGTDSGKTLVSALFAKALNAWYHKPIQAGTPTDTDFLKQHISVDKIVPEQFLLKMPASPHMAAAAEGIELKLNTVKIPEQNPLVIEGAGGCLVPINNDEFVIDIALIHQLPIVLVANLYLGSINHTLLTIEYLKSRGAKVSGIVFNGEENKASQQVIQHHCPWPVITHIPQLEKVDFSALASNINDIQRFYSERR